MENRLHDMGLTMANLGRHLGVSDRTVRRWKKKGAPMWAELYVDQIHHGWRRWKDVHDA